MKWYTGCGKLTEVGRARAQRCEERHTDPYGPGGPAIVQAWVDAQVAHEDTALLINAAAPVARATGAAETP
eukprot:11211521-Alexandrium_andersonii.AAC.1